MNDFSMLRDSQVKYKLNPLSSQASDGYYADHSKDKNSNKQ